MTAAMHGAETIATVYRKVALKIKAAEERVVYDTAIYDPNKRFNLEAGNGFYVVPVTGFYVAVANLQLEAAAAKDVIIVNLKVSSVTKGGGLRTKLGGEAERTGWTVGMVPTECKEGEKIELVAYCSPERALVVNEASMAFGAWRVG